MSDGNGLPSMADTRARLAGLSALNVGLEAQRQQRSERTHSLLPEPTPSRSMRVEAGLIAIQEMEQERDRAQTELAHERAECRALQAELDAVKLAFSRAQSEIEAYRSERDYSVAKRVEVETVFDAALTIMQRHQKKSFVEEVEQSGQA